MEVPDLKKMFITQKRAIKIAHDVHYRFDSVELFTQQATKTLPLLLFYENSISILTHQIYHDHIHHTMTLNVLSQSNQTRAAFQRKLVVRQSRTGVYGDRVRRFNYCRKVQVWGYTIPETWNSHTTCCNIL